MKVLFILLFIIRVNNSPIPKEVYICNNGSTKKYHYTTNCRGLSNCSYKILKSTLDKAKKDGKTLCGWEK